MLESLAVGEWLFLLPADDVPEGSSRRLGRCRLVSGEGFVHRLGRGLQRRVEGVWYEWVGSKPPRESGAGWLYWKIKRK